MSTIHQSRSRVFGIATVLALTLLTPVAVSAQEEVAVTAEEVVVLAPVVAPAVVSTSGEDVRTTRALAAERALQSGDIGSLQEDRLLAIVAAAPSWDATSGYGSVEASRAANALLAPVAGPSWDETSGYASVEASRAVIGHPTTSTNDALPAALERGTRAESAVLWTILHPDDAVSVNPSDDRIAAALFDD
jgi:hypothetical protein